MAYEKMRCEKKEITAGTVRNYYKPIKVFCETNDVIINWKHITRGCRSPESLPKIERQLPKKSEKLSNIQIEG